MTKLKLHEHQQEAIGAIEHQFALGTKRTLAVLATGAGKTMVYLYLADKWVKAGARVLILAHRRELIHQPMDRAKEYFPDLFKKMGVVMGTVDDASEQVTVATVQTANRDRLDDSYDYVILDECHHSTANMYLKMFERYPSAKWLGLTATPFRTDGESLSGIFQTVAYRFPITAAVDRGILVPFEAYGFTLPISVAGITETMEGWAEDALGDLLSADNAIEVVYEKWLEYCSDRNTICFTASVGQAYATAKFFQNKGVRAEAVDGSTPKKKRDGILRLFRKGRIQVVCNCQVWTEGVDIPEASAALMVCPTKSDLSYVQKLGRVLRTAPGKTEAIVLDFAPLEDRNIIMAGDILGGEPFVAKVAKEKAEKAGVMVRVTRVNERGLTVSIDPDVVIVEALKYLRKGFLAWSIQDNMATASLSETVMLGIELPDPHRLSKAEAIRTKYAGFDEKKNGMWDNAKERLYRSLRQHRVWVVKKVGNQWQAGYAGSCKDMKEAIEESEQLVDAGYRPSLAKKKKQWRGRPVSAPQMNYMKQLGISIPNPCNQGQAAQLISHELTCKAISRIRTDTELKIMAGEIK